PSACRETDRASCRVRGDMHPPRSRQAPLFQDERRKDTFQQKPWCPSTYPLSATRSERTISEKTGVPQCMPVIGVSYNLRRVGDHRRLATHYRRAHGAASNSWATLLLSR